MESQTIGQEVMSFSRPKLFPFRWPRQVDVSCVPAENRGNHDILTQHKLIVDSPRYQIITEVKHQGSDNRWAHKLCLVDQRLLITSQGRVNVNKFLEMC